MSLPNTKTRRMLAVTAPVALAMFSLTLIASLVQASSTPKKQLTLDSMSPSLRKMQYAVRGKVVIAADEITEEISKDSSSNKYPFDHIIYTNIGNPHSVGQEPLTWPRQVEALVDLPDAVGVDHPAAKSLFPVDAIARAKEIKKGLGNCGSGAYTHSKGAKCFRQDVADFITARDGATIVADPEDIFLTNGASAGIEMILTTLIADDTCGVMIPIPQYPIYSATIDLLNGHRVGYNLNEKDGWSLQIEELERSLKQAKTDGIRVTALVLINPGNPTGQVLSRENLHEVVKFCSKHNIVLMADEVYQENVYNTNKDEFVSCRRAAIETGLMEKDAIELVSFHSISKGVFGECGRRGGYMELIGIDKDVKDQIYKLASSGLCSSVSGQVMTSLMVRGPDKGSESYKNHEAEKQAIFESLKRRSEIVSSGLDAIDGFSCQVAAGAMYCFPSIQMPEGALKAAEEQGLSPDTLYSLSLLEKTGICVVPASGFGQEEGRFGFRTTFLPKEEEMKKAVQLIKEHYENFCKEYA